MVQKAMPQDQAPALDMVGSNIGSANKYVVMKKIIILFLLALNIQAFSQDALYYTPVKKYSPRDTAAIDQSVVIKYNLGKYFKERQTAWSFTASSVMLSGIGVVFMQSESDISKYLFIGAAISGFTSTVLFYDSEKWLNRASLGIYPGGLRITF